MLNQKDLFNQLTKQQKSSLCHSIKSFVKKNINNSDLFQNFIENELYYIEIGASRLQFLKPLFDNEYFLKELNFYINESVKYYEYQKSLEPFKLAQKEFAKTQRKKTQEFKMSKEPPTKRQISFYKALCKKYNIELQDLQTLSKLDLRNLIRDIKNEHQTD